MRHWYGVELVRKDGTRKPCSYGGVFALLEDEADDLLESLRKNHPDCTYERVYLGEDVKDQSCRGRAS